MQVYKDKYVTLSYFKEKSLFEEVWMEETEDMEDEEFMKIELILADLFLKYKPEKLYSDTLNLRYAVAPEMQVWLDINVAAKAMEAGIKKIARIMSSDFIAQISLEQLMEEKHSEIADFENRYFDDEAEAREWLDL